VRFPAEAPKVNDNSRLGFLQYYACRARLKHLNMILKKIHQTIEFNEELYKFELAGGGASILTRALAARRRTASPSPPCNPSITPGESPQAVAIGDKAADV
jgi:hypothetical protein